MGDRIDSDGNGKISGKEFRDFCEENAGEYKTLIKEVQQAMIERKLSLSAGKGETVMLKRDQRLGDGSVLKEGQKGTVVHLDITGTMDVAFEGTGHVVKIHRAF